MQNLHDMTKEQLIALATEAAKLVKTQEMQERRASFKPYCKVSQSGAVSLYLGGKFPTTLYADQWAKVIANIDMIGQFLKENESILATKQTKSA
jgi:hypothetical protein